MQSVSSNAVAQEVSAINTALGSKANYGFYDANTDRSVESNRTNAILYVTKNLKYEVYTIRYSGGYYYFYLSNPQSSSEKTILEINPYSGTICVFYTNVNVATITKTKQI